MAAKEQEGQTLPSRLPRHLAIIMDGNGRWAKKRALPRSLGHKAGAETFRRMATYCKEIGIPYLTVYAFSTENWKRPADEVSGIMRLLEQYLIEAVESMAKDRIALGFLGDLSVLSPRLLALCEETRRIGLQYEPALRVQVCLNYGGRDEIVRACRSLAQDCVNGTRSAQELTETDISRALDTAKLPDPDLVIRPSGEMRISNFLIWQTAYAEFAFTDVLWPDFDEAELCRILWEFAKRERRYGGV